jgi:hypothetical protein
MATVFGRGSNGAHLLEPALEDLERGSDEARAMAWNIRNDWRVSERREQAFLPADRPANGSALRDHLTIYFEKRVRLREFPVKGGIAPPDFATDVLNQFNRVRGMDPDFLLVRVLDLGGLLTVFRNALADAATRRDLRELSMLLTPDPGSGDGLIVRIDRHLQRAGEPAIVQFANMVIRALASQAHRPFQPVWVTTLAAFSDVCQEGRGFWKETFETYLRPPSTREQERRIIDGPAERWTQLLGVPKTGWANGTWLLVLRYPSREADPIYRPTILDAGWFPEHFPSPPEGGPKGHPVDLRHEPSAARLIPEYVHPQFHHRPEHFLALKRLPGPVGRHLTAFRQANLNLLRRKYPTIVW